MDGCAAIESIGMSSEIKEQYEKNEKFVGGEFLIPPYIFLVESVKSEGKRRTEGKGREEDEKI